MKKTLIISAITLIILAVAGYLLFARGDGGKYDFRFDQVSIGDLAVNVTATGTINAVTTVDVGTQVSGIISKLYADFNSMVKEGQVIAQIDPTFLQHSVKDAEANLERAKAQIEDSKRTFVRTKTLYEKQLAAQENYDSALTALESNQAALKMADATLDRAKTNLSYATIYAPINGVVIDRKVNVGQTVAASFSSPTLFTIANDLSKMQVQTTVDESDIGKVSMGQQATFSVDAYPEEKFSGVVSQIRLAPLSIQNVVNYTVIIEVANDQLKLMPGMTANVKILIASDQKIMRVPNMALRFQPPAELIDSTKIEKDQPAAAHDGHRGSRSDTSGTNRSISDSAKVKVVLPSIHREELSAVLTKPRPEDGTKYGVTQIFPEYQKSAYIPAHESGSGKVWILNAKQKLEPFFVRTGLTDGKFTEITSTQLKDGDRIVIGASVLGESVADQARSPLTGSAPAPTRGGFRP